MSAKVSAKQLKRYWQPQVVEHLASQFVLGTLSTSVNKRVIQLCGQNELLEQAINHWQQSFVTLDWHTSELPPSEKSWQNIVAELKCEEQTRLSSDRKLVENRSPENKSEENLASKSGLFTWISNWLALPISRMVSISAVVLVFLLALILNSLPSQKPEVLSYVAILTEHNGQAHLVATTYGLSKKLIIDIIQSPKVNEEQSLQLWALSKTDQEARSLAIIPHQASKVSQQLTQAQWRLIKDAHSLIVTVEEAGGSPIDEPSEIIISRGLCIRLAEQNNV